LQTLWTDDGPISVDKRFSIKCIEGRYKLRIRVRLLFML